MDEENLMLPFFPNQVSEAGPKPAQAAKCRADEVRGTENLAVSIEGEGH